MGMCCLLCPHHRHLQEVVAIAIGVYKQVRLLILGMQDILAISLHGLKLGLGSVMHALRRARLSPLS
jgi:hypothetical protein